MEDVNLNKIHGPSRVLLVTDDYRLPDGLIESLQALEIVYVATETFDDGYETTNVYYRVPDPNIPSQPTGSKRPVAKPQPITVVKKFLRL